MDDRPTNGQTTAAHPIWCDDQHEGNVHRGVVGAVEISGRTVEVVILQTAGDWPPSVVMSGCGVGVVQVDATDLEDMAGLMALTGQGALAALLRRAGEVLEAGQ